MRLKELVEIWESSAGERRTRRSYSVRLPMHDAAKIAALSEMFPGRSEQDIITDLISAALDELEASFPYVQGSRVVAEDERGDPIHEDTGRTPRFRELTAQHLRRLDAEQAAEEE